MFDVQLSESEKSLYLHNNVTIQKRKVLILQNSKFLIKATEKTTGLQEIDDSIYLQHIFIDSAAGEWSESGVRARIQLRSQLHAVVLKSN